MTEITPIRTQAETQLLGYLREQRPGLPDGDGSVIGRAVAAARLERDGLPNRRVEEWKYTDLRALLREAAAPAARPSESEIAAARARARLFADVAAVRIDFVNGHLAGHDAAPEGVAVIGLAQALAEAHPALSNLNRVTVAAGNAAYDLNRAFLSDGVVVHVAAGREVAAPLHLRFVNHGTASFATAPRVLVVLDKGAALTVIESHEGDIAVQPNSVVEFVLDDDARVEHVRVNAEAAQTLALSTVTAAVGARAAFRSVNLHAGAAVVRHQLFIACEGEDARVTLGGVTVIAGGDHADTTLVVDHAVPGGESRELFKTVVGGEARGVFQGKIIVRPDAQKTDGRMMSAALLLSPDATMNNKPELEIWADDVQCAHGATCGELDAELLFYLMARGLPREEAQALLLQAFIGEALELVTDDALRAAMNSLAVERLAILA
ncbi:MAG: Fe-S cluster assembly protein SufD [Pseudochelatococcus sp.]|jgi:Fe-S cluster assembly protein SufD|uniref:Fe-S cluster assembly protein SufD n=1 Tax=Pseudochelatococcus sp. TaxID=2020869 RepID=UPI003D8DEE47